MLQRCLSDVEAGFYIDVGANDPEYHSVTKRFYDQGWSGINIEPSKSYFDRLQAARPRDINLQVVVSNKDGISRFFEIEGTGISTTEEDVSVFHGANGFVSQEREVKALTLATICRQHVAGPVHFLKIDVEGGTKSVLEGVDLCQVRPWVIVIEATKPATQIEDFDEWEHLILSQSYLYVYADGLNRFYLAAEQADRWLRFKYPPNIFDDFLPSAIELGALVQVQNNWGQAAEAKIAELGADKAVAEAALHTHAVWGQAAEAKIAELTVQKAAAEEAFMEQVSRTQVVEAQLQQQQLELAVILRTHNDWGQAAEARIALLEGESTALKANLEAEIGRARLNAELAARREAVLQRVEASLSWRMTGPLRYWQGESDLLTDG